MNEESPLESSLDLALTQHHHDENPESQEVRPRLEVEPLLNLVLSNFSKFSNLGDFVTGRPHFNDELETICEGFYETKNTSFLYGL